MNDEPQVGDVADAGVEDAGNQHELDDAEEADLAHVGLLEEVRVGVGVAVWPVMIVENIIYPFTSFPPSFVHQRTVQLVPKFPLRQFSC